MADVLLYILAGASVGFLIGMTGVGGGSLMTPMLLGFGFAPPVAIGTDLLYAALTKTGGAFAHHRRGNVNWRIVILLASGSLPVSVLLHFYLSASGLQEGEGFAELLTTSLGIMLIITSIILLFKDKMRMSALHEKPGFIMGHIHRHQETWTVVMGILLGICVTLSSVGAGAFAAAVLLMIYSSSPVIRIIGSDVAHAVPLTMIAGLGYLITGYVDLTLLACLLIGSLPAIHLGTLVSSSVPERLLHRLLVTLLILLGINYAFF